MLHIRQLSRQELETYRHHLQPINFSYYGHPFPYGYPVELPLATARHLAASANTIQQIVIEAIRERGLTAWLADHAPRMGKEVINYSAINHQLERRVLEQHLCLPLVYDGLIALEHGRAHFRITEIQSCIGYGPWHERLVQAAGYTPTENVAWLGPENPADVLKRIKRALAGGSHVTVLDADPTHGSGLQDQLLMAKALGDRQSLPLAALDIEFDSELGYYYYRYALDAATGGPLRDTRTGMQLKTAEKVPITHVLSRMTQSDLNTVDTQLGADAEKRALLERFLRDETLVWLQHPAWQHIIDKSTLPFLRQTLLERNLPLQADFVPIYGAGEQVPPGKYVRKPTREAGGTDQSVEYVRSMDVAPIVEPEYVYQQFLQPYPFAVSLLEELTGKFPVPRTLPVPLREDVLFANWQPNQAATSVELRGMALPWGKGELSLYFQARLAPRYVDPATREFAQTNIVKMYKAFTHITAEEYALLPFGWCPALI